MIQTIKVHHSVDGEFVQKFTNNHDYSLTERTIKHLLTLDYHQGDEVLIQSINFPFISSYYPGFLFYMFNMEVPLDILQIDTHGDFILDDDMDQLGLPSKGLIHNIEKEDLGGKKLIEIYDLKYLNEIYNYGLWNCSIPEFKMEYLKNIELWIINNDEEKQFLLDVSFMINLDEPDHESNFNEENENV